MSTLTPKIVREIRSKARDWQGMCEMMMKHKIAQTTVAGIVRGKSYTWFEPENIPAQVAIEHMLAAVQRRVK